MDQTQNQNASRPPAFSSLSNLQPPEHDTDTKRRVVLDSGHSVAVPEQRIGFALKVEDGAQRAQFPAVIRLLQHLDVLPAKLPTRLEEFARRGIRNTRGECVGEVRPVA